MAEDTEWNEVGKLRYDPSKHFGSGSFGTVFAGYFGRKKVAVKRIQKQHVDTDHESLMPSEAELMQTADDHPNILRYVCTEKDAHFVFIATEWCAGTLGDYVKGNYKGPEIGDEKEILHQITQGLAYLHRIGIVHRDIKPNNILIWVPSTEIVKDLVKPKMKLADFGLSKFKKMGADGEEFSTLTNPHGAEGWMAPELIRSSRNENNIRHYDYSVDIFPLGCVFGYTLSVGGKHPFGNDPIEQNYRIGNGEPMVLTSADLKVPYCYDEFFIPLIQSMVLTKAGQRPTADQVLNNELFRPAKEQQRNSNNAADMNLSTISNTTDDEGHDEKSGSIIPVVLMSTITDSEDTNILPLTDQGLLDKNSKGYRMLLDTIHRVAGREPEMVQRAIAWSLYNRALLISNESGESTTLAGVCRGRPGPNGQLKEPRNSTGSRKKISFAVHDVGDVVESVIPFATAHLFRNGNWNGFRPKMTRKAIDNWLPEVYKRSDPSNGSTYYIHFSKIEQVPDSFIRTVQIGSYQFFKGAEI